MYQKSMTETLFKVKHLMNRSLAIYKLEPQGTQNEEFCFFVFGWDFNLILSKVFVTCVRQLNTIFSFFINVPRKTGKILSALYPVKTISCVPGKVGYLHHTCPKF